MTEKFEYKGYWYLPSMPTNKVAGILTFIPNESMRLELFGMLEESELNLSNILEREHVDIIWGITSDAHKISLINCIPSGSQYNFSSTFPIIRYSIQYCLEGIHIKDWSDKRFSWCNIIIPDLTNWCHPGLLEIQYTPNSDDREETITVSTRVNKTSVPVVSVNIDKRTTLNIKREVCFVGSFGLLNPAFKQSTFLQIEKGIKSSVSDFLADVSLFEEYISLSFLSIIKATSISLYDENNYQELNNNKQFHKIKLFYVQENSRYEETKKRELLMPYAKIEDIFPHIIKKWFLEDTSNIAPIRTHLIRSIKNKRSFDSTDFLIVIQAIEGFCIRFRKEQSLTRMLEEIITEFSDIEKINSARIDIKSTVDSRHYYSHFMNKSEKANTLSGIDLYYLTEKLRILLICCLLKFMGIENKRIDELLNNSNNSKLY